MAWRVSPAGEWSVATTDNPAGDTAAALALPGTWQWKDSLHQTFYIHKSQVANLTSAGPPVAGYTAWYDASQIAGQADNTPLATWPDSSGHGNDLTQPSGVARPIYYKTTAAKLVNGKPAVWFSSAASTGMTSSTAVAPPQTALVVAQIGSLADNEAFIGSVILAGVEFRTSAGHLHLIAENSAAVAGPSTGSLPLTPSFAAFTFNGTSGTNASFYINSATADSTFAAVAALTVSSAYSIGEDGYAGGGDNLNGPLCEVITYPTVLTAPQIASTYNYLKAKWGTP